MPTEVEVNGRLWKCWDGQEEVSYSLSLAQGNGRGREREAERDRQRERKRVGGEREWAGSRAHLIADPSIA